eukprot:gene823-461_t
MPALEIDVKNIPDIIEAQLTLSYTRLSDLIRVLVEQGNAHDDELGELRRRIDGLESQNADLQKQLAEATKKDAEKENAAVMGLIEDLRKEFADMQVDVATHRRLAETADECQKAKLEQFVTTYRQEKEQLQDGIGLLSKDLAGLRESHGVVRAFYDLWAAEDIAVTNMAARSAADPELFENSEEDRTVFLHTLTPFMNMKEEIDALRTLLQRLSTEAMHRPSGEGEGTPETRGEIAAIQERLRLLEQQLRDLGVDASEGLSMARRIAFLEEAVDGIGLPGSASVGGQRSTGSNQHLPPGVDGSAVTNPLPAAAGAAPAPPNIYVGDYLKSGSSSRTTSVHPSEPSNPARAAGRTSLPPLGGAAAAATISQRPSIAVLTVGQPHVELLRSEAGAEDGAGSATAAGAPRVSILFPEEGIRRRLEQIEENVAMLELKKADRSEMAILEEALRQLLIQTATSRGAVLEQEGHGTTRYGSPFPPGSTVNPGRPMFANGGQSINLRAGARPTNATISPTGPHDNRRGRRPRRPRIPCLIAHHQVQRSKRYIYKILSAREQRERGPAYRRAAPFRLLDSIRGALRSIHHQVVAARAMAMAPSRRVCVELYIGNQMFVKRQKQQQQQQQQQQQKNIRRPPAPDILGPKKATATKTERLCGDAARMMGVGGAGRRLPSQQCTIVK